MSLEGPKRLGRGCTNLLLTSKKEIVKAPVLRLMWSDASCVQCQAPRHKTRSSLINGPQNRSNGPNSASPHANQLHSGPKLQVYAQAGIWSKQQQLGELCCWRKTINYVGDLYVDVSAQFSKLTSGCYMEDYKTKWSFNSFKFQLDDNHATIVFSLSTIFTLFSTPPKP